MEAGVSTACFYPMDTKDAFRMLAENGVKNIEFFVNSFSELEPDYIRELKAIQKEYGVTIPSLHPFTCPLETLLFFSEYPARRRDGLEFYKPYFQVAQELGVKYFVLHGENLAGKLPAEKSYESIRQMVDCAAEFGVQVIQENVDRCKSSQPEYLVNMKKAVPNIKFLLDVKQAVRSGRSPFEFIDSVGEDIAHIHISDHTKENPCLPIGKGELELSKLIKELFAKGFDQCLMLELYRENFKDLEDVLKSYRTLLQNIENNVKLFDRFR